MGVRILIVDDDFRSRNFLLNILAHSAKVDVAVTGKEAVDAVKAAHAAKSPYSLIFMDVWMPEKDGQVALKEIRQFEQSRSILAMDKSKIIMTTGSGDAQNVAAAFENQCDGYLKKPYTENEVVAQLVELGFSIGKKR